MFSQGRLESYKLAFVCQVLHRVVHVSLLNKPMRNLHLKMTAGQSILGDGISLLLSVKIVHA